MELLNLISFSLPVIFYLKISFVTFLFIFNIYLIFTHKKEEPTGNKEILQAGFGNKNLKKLIGSLVYIGGFLGTLITLKNELKNIQIGRLDQLMEEEREEIRRSIDQDKVEHQRLLSSVENTREELYKYHVEKAKMLGHNDRLLTLHNSIKDHVVSYHDKSTDPSTKLYELGILDQLIKQDTDKFGQELNSLILPIGDNTTLGEGSSSDPGKGTTPSPSITDNTDDLKESCVFNFNIITTMDWFEGLNGIKKLAVSLLISKSVVFSALISIIFVFYGNILIEKYDLENKYPKLAKLIQLRRKFQKYYFNYYCGLILLAVVTEVAFALAVLF
jgi:hypothetical protein